MLELNNIYKHYTTGEFTQTALAGVNLKFRQNEFAAILGPSGSGKTTLLNIAGGLAQYDEGDLKINGQSTKTFKDRDWDAYRNNSVGFIFQSYNLITHLSVVDNVMMGMTLSGVPKEMQKSRALAVLGRVGLSDHVHKKPNQLSGGQMQRVAIARSLMNDPDIILADEPTGALDTKTSEQIMTLIAEIAQDKLVIMVTHNPELAATYATRTIEFRDGQVVHDSAPVEAIQPSHDYQMRRTSMSFWNALKLSGKNITTKKWRTGLIAFASSIGIIGIALVLSLSNGFDKQISSVENDTLSGYPITISKVATTANFGPPQFGDEPSQSLKKQRDGQLIYADKSTEEEIPHDNQLSDEFLTYLSKLTGEVAGINRVYNSGFNLISQQGEVKAVNQETIGFTSYPSPNEGPQSDFLKENFDLLAGNYPTNKHELVLVIGENNQLSSELLLALGLSADDLTFDTVIGYEINVIPNDDYYQQEGAYFKAIDEQIAFQKEGVIPLTVAGIIRVKEGLEISGVSEGLKYSQEFAAEVINLNRDSAILKAQREADYNVMTGEAFVAVALPEPSRRMSNVGTMPSAVSALTKEQLLTKLGEGDSPDLITIYPKDFAAKEEVLSYLTDWNTGKPESEQIEYSDMAATVTSLMGSVLDGITIVLVAFAAISLVVSLIMIGIITYISVMERTREIGVLRALGARKKDITRVFNAETFIIGTCSGLLGIGVAYLLTIPVNLVLENMTEMSNIAQLNPIHALLLGLVSILLTMLGGMLPARMAAKKDPVEALGAD